MPGTRTTAPPPAVLRPHLPLLSTQYLEEAGKLAGQIAVIDHGRSWPGAPAPSSRPRPARGHLANDEPIPDHQRST